MKPKIYIVMFLLFSAICAFVACTSPKSEAVARMQELYQETKQNYKTYSVDDWNAYLIQYNELDSLLNTFEFTEDEKKAMGEIKGRCAAYAREASVIQENHKKSNTLRDSRGVFKGFSTGIGD